MAVWPHKYPYRRHRGTGPPVDFRPKYQRAAVVTCRFSHQDAEPLRSPGGAARPPRSKLSLRPRSRRYNHRVDL